MTFVLQALSRTIVFISVIIFCTLPAYSALPYLEDANTKSPPSANPNQPSFSHHKWPRIMMSETQNFSGDVEKYSKYHIIATMAGAIPKIVTLQNKHPGLMYFRMVNPNEYLGFESEDRGVYCPQSHGNPFESTGPSTTGCSVYSGHWLYQTGTTTRSSINDSQTSIPVADANRFTVGQYAVIYNAPAGSFNSAEHVKITGRNVSGKTISVQRGYKSTARLHPGGAIVAQHVLGHGGQPRNWAYNMSTAAPRDSAGRRYYEVLPSWMAQNYKKDERGNSTNVAVSGLLFDSDFHFMFSYKKADVNNDLVLDDGISSSGTNWYGDGYDQFYKKVRGFFPNLIIVGGYRNVRGFDSLNGIQMEGFPMYRDYRTTNPDYTRLGALVAMYGFQMRHRQVGAPHSHTLSKVPTKLYPFGNSPAPTHNKGFRLSFGMTLLEDGYFGVVNNYRHPDMWFDEYAVNTTPGSSTYGHAIGSNPSDESQTRAHRGWLGTPLGPRKRLYSDTQFATSGALLQSNFDSNISGWTTNSVNLARETSSSHVKDGSGSLRIGTSSSYQKSLYQTQIKTPAVNLSNSKEYTLVFSAKADALREVEVGIGNHDQRIMLDNTWQRFVLTFKPQSSGSQRVTFFAGRENIRTWLDTVYIFEGNPDVFRRDFQKGIVVVNATPSSKTISLGGSFKRIKGTQDAVNNGATVTSVTLPAYDALVLVRPDGSVGGDGGDGGGNGGGGSGGTPDSENPTIQIDAPTKSSSGPITNTKITVHDNESISASTVQIQGTDTTNATNLNCSQTNGLRVDCTIRINKTGDLYITATDASGNKGYSSEKGYQISGNDGGGGGGGKFWFTINAPTKTKSSPITDTLVIVRADAGVSASAVKLRPDNTAGVSALNCVQVGSTRVECRPRIISSGTLKLLATDNNGQATYDNEYGYTISGNTGNKFWFNITAPTKTKSSAITDTLVIVRADAGMSASAVKLRPDNTAGVSALNCVQVGSTRVECRPRITSSGTLKLLATDNNGQVTYDNESGYTISGNTGSKFWFKITAPTKTKSSPITDTLVIVRADAGISASAVKLRPDNSAGVSALNCAQVSSTRVECNPRITSSGTLKVLATDNSGQVTYDNESGYRIN